MSDANFSSVSLLLLFNGTDGSTTFTDSSNNGYTPTVNGNAQLSTSSPKFGSAAGLFDGNGDYLTYAGATPLVLGTGDFTIDFWLKSTMTTAGWIACSDESTGNTNFWGIDINQGNSSGKVSFWRGSSPGEVIAQSSTGVNDGNWHHVAFTRASGTLRLYVDGVHKTGATATDDMGTVAAGVMVGNVHGFPTFGINGRLDCFRITKGLARWTGTGNFTAPTSEADYLPAGGGPFPHYVFRRNSGGFYIPGGL